MYSGGSITEYSGDLNTGLVWYSNGQKLSDCRMVVIQMPFEYRTSFCPVFGTPFEYWTGIRMVILIPNYHLNTGHLNTGQIKVCYSYVSFFRCSLFRSPLYTVMIWITDETGFLMVESYLILEWSHNWTTIWKPDNHSNWWYLNTRLGLIHYQIVP